jgi:hypothetical protein
MDLRAQPLARAPLQCATISGNYGEFAEARRHSEIFFAEMADNRPNSDDAGVARNILSELERYGERWCHTDGSLYHTACLSPKQFAAPFTAGFPRGA